MSVYDVLIYPDPRLRQVAKPVTEFNDELKAVCDKLLATMYHYNGCGLAATQVGVNMRIYVMDTTRDQSDPIVFINPEITATEGRMPFQEGCISFPGVYIQTEHAHKVTVKYQDVDGAFQEVTYEGNLESACVQHELEHLDGILMIDHLSRMKRERALKKLEKELKILRANKDTL